MEIIRKAAAAAAGEDEFEFVMSDATVDRYGDVIEPDGWRLANFKRNPVALFGHDAAAFPIGTWQNVRVESGKLLGRLELLARGLSARVDEIRSLIEAGIIRAVSVGFRPISDMLEAMPGNTGGIRFKAAELVECSVVNIPANPNALRVAKALKISDEARALLFGEQAEEDSAALLRRQLGETAAKQPLSRTKKMATLAERIVDAQNDIVRLKDQLNDHIKDENADEIVTGELADQIEQKEASLAALKRAEVALAAKASAPEQQSQEPRRPFAQAAKKSDPKDLIIRSAVVKVLIAHVEKRSHLDVLQERYGEPTTRSGPCST
jgi:HK97 family phage prohead protease